VPVGASAGVVADLHFDFELPPFNEGVYREDVPKVRTLRPLDWTTHLD
jgi:hypothetical protein